MQSKARSIELVDLKHELLPSGRKLLQCFFKDKFGTSHYVWTPFWKGDFGIEKLFFTALETEEWNDYDGAWSKELKEASKEIPSLEEIRLPVKIRLGEIEEVIRSVGDVPQSFYRVAIEVLSDEVRAWKDDTKKPSFICIGNVKISWDAFRGFITKQARIRGASNDVDILSEGNEFHGDWKNVGVRFYVLLEAGLDKTDYQNIGREIASQVRSFVRKRLSDHRALKRGFEEE